MRRSICFCFFDYLSTTFVPSLKTSFSWGIKKNKFLQVSSRDDVPRLAGKIAWNARRGENVPMLASGEAAITTAVTAIAMARKYLGRDEIPVELLCQPAFRDERRTASLAFYVTTSAFKKNEHGSNNFLEYTVSKTSKPPTVAGALAARAREGIGPHLGAIGEEAICVAVLAICRARLYLEDDRLDIRFVPIKEAVEKKGGDGISLQLPSMKFVVYVERV